MRVDERERRVEREGTYVRHLERESRSEMRRVNEALTGLHVKAREVKTRFAGVVRQLREGHEQGSAPQVLAKRMSSLSRELPILLTKLREVTEQRETFVAMRTTLAQKLASYEGARTTQEGRRTAIVQELEFSREEAERDEWMQRAATTAVCAPSPLGSSEGAIPLQESRHTSPPQSSGTPAYTASPLDGREPAPTHEAPVQVEASWTQAKEEGVRVSTHIGGERLYLTVSDEDRRKLAVEIESESPSGGQKLRSRRASIERALRAAGLVSRVAIR